jgi:hypothetical protein
MATRRSQASRSTTPQQVWADLALEAQDRAVQLLAQMALNFFTAQIGTTQKEDTICSNSEIIPSYAPTISPDRR